MDEHSDSKRSASEVELNPRQSFQGIACGFLAMALLSCWSCAFAQDPKHLYKNEVQRLSATSALAEEDLGANVSLYDGSVEYRFVDIDIKGNSALPVRLARYMRPVPTYQQNTATGKYDYMPQPRIFGIDRWQFEVPYITMTTAKGIGWQNDTQRCNNPLPAGKPPSFSLQEVWNGHHIFIPGVGSQLLYADDAAQAKRVPYPTDGKTYRWLTRDFYRLTCLSSTANGYPGEGFLAISPGGTKYFFNWGYESPGATLYRQNDQTYAQPSDVDLIQQDLIHVTLLATRIEDRFGNWVSFSYTANNDLSRIESNDGRYIQLTQTTAGLTVTSSIGTWTYTKQGALPGRVTYPDGSYGEWTVGASWGVNYEPPDYFTVGLMATCQLKGRSYGSGSVHLRYPSGANAVYEFQYLEHRRSGMYKSCQEVADYNYRLSVPNYWGQYSLVKKTISGPGLSDLVTQYDYQASNGIGTYESDFRLSDGTCSACRTTKLVSVTHPDLAKSIYKFGVVYEIDEGDLLEQQEWSAQGALLRTTKFTYMDYDRMLTQSYASFIGNSFVQPMSYKAARFFPVVKTEIQQDGTSFVTTVNGFDVFVRPINVTKTSALLP